MQSRKTHSKYYKRGTQKYLLFSFPTETRVFPATIFLFQKRSTVCMRAVDSIYFWPDYVLKNELSTGSSPPAAMRGRATYKYFAVWLMPREETVRMHAISPEFFGDAFASDSAIPLTRESASIPPRAIYLFRHNVTGRRRGVRSASVEYLANIDLRFAEVNLPSRKRVAKNNFEICICIFFFFSASVHARCNKWDHDPENGTLSITFAPPLVRANVTQDQRKSKVCDKFSIVYLIDSVHLFTEMSAIVGRHYFPSCVPDSSFFLSRKSEETGL